MSRKVRRVPVALDAKDVTELSVAEIRIILRGADELIMSGGRGLLAKVLKGSRQKSVLEHELDQSPAYGALSDLSLQQITARIDWLIINHYLDIEYDYRLPLLVYAPKGWEIERETYADEMLARLDEQLDAADETGSLSWLTERHPEELLLVLDKIAASANAKYLPVLDRWNKKATRRMRPKISATREALQRAQQPVPGTT